MVGFIPSSFYSMIKTDSLFIITTMLLSLSTILLDPIRDFPVTIQTYVQMVFFFLRLDDMHASLPYLKYRSPPFLMLHRHMVPLFASQSFLCSSDALAHLCAGHYSAVNTMPIPGCLRR